MKERSEGAGRRGEPTPSEAKRPEKNQPTLEVGEGRHGVPPPDGEQKPQGGGINRPELHPPEGEMSELARENKEFFKKLAKLIDPEPLSEDFEQRLMERLR